MSIRQPSECRTDGRCSGQYRDPLNMFGTMRVVGVGVECHVEREVMESHDEVLDSFLCMFALHSSEQTYLISHLNGENGIMIRQAAHETTPASKSASQYLPPMRFWRPSARHNQPLNPARCRVLLVPAYHGKRKEAPAYLRKPGTDTISPQIRRLLYLVNRAGTARCVRPDVAMDATD